MTLKNNFRALLATFAVLGGVVGAIAAGSYTNGLTSAALPLTGNELLPADTQLPSGQNPQTEAISTSTLKDYVLGNAASADATASGGAATANGGRGTITTASLTTAAGATYTLTLTNSKISATSLVFVSVGLGSATTGTPAVTTVTPGSGSVAVIVQNIHASAALNGTLKIRYMVVN